MMRPRVFFYVQYLEGIGHVVRAARIARALADLGADVMLALGGEPVPHVVAGERCTGPPATGAGEIAVCQLPPVHVQPDSYSRLYQSDGTPVDAPFEQNRCRILLDAFAQWQPDVLMTEAYPFGRWAMHFELKPLLAAARGRGCPPLVLSSVRDILQVPKSAEKVDVSMALFREHYDGVLVHGDPRFIRIEESFPRMREVLDQCHYTGLVVPSRTGGIAPTREDDDCDAHDVIVSGGGGAIGFEVLKAALQAKSLTALAAVRWLVLAGPRMSEGTFAQLQELASHTGADLVRFHPEPVSLMSRAKLSIQRAGYNTAADLLQAGCRGVLVPDTASGQREQWLRASRLARSGWAAVVAEETLSAETMAEGIARALTLDPQPLTLDTSGARTTAGMVVRLLRERSCASR